MNFPTPQALVHMDSGWKVSFDPKFRGPVEPQTFNRLMDISQSENDSIRYYSGTIRYENEFTLADKPSGELFLNLNDVGVMAKVKINGTYAGGVWTPPYRVRVTDLVQPGTNRVEIEVVTTWMNRLIGDSGLPEAERGGHGHRSIAGNRRIRCKNQDWSARFVWKQFSNKKSRIFHLPSAKIRFPKV